MIDLASAEPGAVVATYSTEPITRHALAVYAGASGDYNPIHVDIDFARGAGMPDVFAQGMLVMGYLGRFVNLVSTPDRLREFSTRFLAITQVGDAITCTARLIRTEQVDGETRARLELLARNQAGDLKLKGEAIVAI
ncbi:MAG: MaoC/PaaZ C-terminal domain-containing protein [Gemmatimonadota bacterium]